MQLVMRCTSRGLCNQECYHETSNLRISYVLSLLFSARPGALQLMAFSKCFHINLKAQQMFPLRMILIVQVYIFRKPKKSFSIFFEHTVLAISFAGFKFLSDSIVVDFRQQNHRSSELDYCPYGEKS